MDDQTCTGCFYAVPVIGDDKLPNMKCVRFPPQTFVLFDEVCQAFPDAFQRCGEYKEVEDVEEDPKDS